MQDVLRHASIGASAGMPACPGIFISLKGLGLGAYALTYPLAILVVLGLVPRLLRNELSADMKFIQKLLAWVLVIIIGLSVPAGKKIRYILAFVPPLALICGYLFMQQQPRFLSLLRRVVFDFCAFFPLFCALLLDVLCVVANAKGLYLNIPVLKLNLVFLVLLWLCYLLRKRELWVLGLAGLTFVLSYILMVEPVNISINRTRTFVADIESLRHKKHDLLVFYHQNPDALPIKYIVNMPQEQQPLFINTPDQLQGFARPAFFYR